MNPKFWPLLGIVFVGFVALLMDAADRDDLDPDSLPPPAAGMPVTRIQTKNTCEDIVYSKSVDGIKYVRESGGGILLAAEIDKVISFFQLGEYGSLNRVGHAEMDSETAKKLKYALINCDARYLPSGVNFAYR